MSLISYPNADSKLILQYIEGDASSGEALAGRLRGQIRHLVRQYVITTEDAEDLTQECLVRLFECMPNLDVARPLYPWLAAIVRNVSVNWLRQKSRSKTVQFSEDADQLLQAPSEEARINEKVTVLDGVLNTLDASDRNMLELRYYYGLGYAEIGDKIGVSTDCVRKRISRILDRLQRDKRMKSLLDEEVKM